MESDGISRPGLGLGLASCLIGRGVFAPSVNSIRNREVAKRVFALITLRSFLRNMCANYIHQNIHEQADLPAALADGRDFRKTSNQKKIVYTNMLQILYHESPFTKEGRVLNLVISPFSQNKERKNHNFYSVFSK